MCPNKFKWVMIAHPKIPIIATKIWTTSLIFGERSFISSITAIIPKKIAPANKACTSLNCQYPGISKMILTITAKIKKIHISLGTGCFLFKSLYFQGLSIIQSFLNNHNHPNIIKKLMPILASKIFIWYSNW